MQNDNTVTFEVKHETKTGIKLYHYHDVYLITQPGKYPEFISKEIWDYIMLPVQQNGMTVPYGVWTQTKEAYQDFLRHRQFKPITDLMLDLGLL